MSWQTFIARRYLRGGHSGGSVSAQTAIGVAGVTLGVAALLVVQAVMAGFTEKLKEQMLGATAHILVVAPPSETSLGVEGFAEAQKRIKNVPGVTALTPFFRKEAMISRAERVGAVRLFGVDPATAGDATIFPHKMEVGSFENLRKPGMAENLGDWPKEKIVSSTLPGIILGRDLAAEIDAVPGDEVRIICPLCGIGPLGPTASVKAFILVGVFEVGNIEYDGQFGFVLLQEAQRFFNPEGEGELISGIQVKVDDLEAADKIAAQISYALGPTSLWVTHWKTLLGPLFDALQLEKLALFVVLLIIVLVAAFNIAGMEVLFVREKVHEIAILKAMGAPSTGITRVFLSRGAFVGFLGTLLGLSLGLGVCYLQERFHLIQVDASVYQMKYMPVLVLPMDVIKVILAPTFITTVAAYLPARRAGKLPPTEALRSE